MKRKENLQWHKLGSFSLQYLNTFLYLLDRLKHSGVREKGSSFWVLKLKQQVPASNKIEMLCFDIYAFKGLIFAGFNFAAKIVVSEIREIISQ